jgi:Tfp pilus assembly protein PilO
VKLELRVWRERAWVVGPAVVFFLGNFGFFLGSRAVDASREAGLKKDLDAARARFAAAEEGVRKAGTEQSHIENVRKAAEEFYGNQIGTVDETMSRTVAEIHQVCRKAGVQAHQIGYAAKPMTKVPLIEMSVDFGVDGNYATLRRLILGFEQDPRWLVIRQVQLARKGETVGEGNIHIEVATYFYQSGDDPTATFKTVNLK